MMKAEDEREFCPLPDGSVVEFYPLGHKYVYNGVVLPSITTLLKKVYGDCYSSVDPVLLKRSAEYGTQIHREISSLIEMREEGIDIKDLINNCTHQETKNYFNFIEPIYKVAPVDTEKVVVLKNKVGISVAAGRFDLLAKIKEASYICDFKTTSSIHRQLVTAQLNLYLIAAIQSGYLDSNKEHKLAAIHLSGEKAKLVPIPVLGEGFVNKIIN